MKSALNVLFQAVLWGVAIAVLIENGIVLKQNRDLRRAQVAMLSDTAVSPGRILRNMAGASLDGRVKAIATPETEQDKLLLITFSPACPQCQASMAKWSLMAEDIRRRTGWRIIWVSRDGIQDTSDYCKERKIPASEVVADPTYRTYLELGLKAVPSTMVVGRHGIVEKVWPGRIDDANGWNEISSYLQIRTEAGKLIPR